MIPLEAPSRRSLLAEGLVKFYGGKRVVSSVSLRVNQGEVVGLLGPNGAGKTTTFYMMVGLVKPDEGRVFLGERDITGLPMPKRARLGLGYLPQEQSIFWGLRVWENVYLVLEELGVTEVEDMERLCAHVMSEVGISHMAQEYAYNLSGGERRKVEIARVLATMPEFLLLDEPFGGVDPITVYDLQQIIISLKRKGYGVLLTDHNVRETLSITDRAYIMHGGSIMVEGTPGEIVSHREARRYYLGEAFKI